ncbi:MAG: UDP-N-acetylmuramoyl-L-alanine--D-glutamate ligase [Acidobacteria bacterium]|nr:UDP-N-acetylmuramoyl-L-alanine--D-glutamate ligase [Acidobacteriota bacterium]
MAARPDRRDHGHEADTFHPWIAALLNVSPDHLDRHSSQAAYELAKARIFVNQVEGDWAVVNRENDAAVRLVEHTRATVVGYALDRQDTARFFADAGFIWQRTSEGETPLVPLEVVRVSGRHTLSNVVAATAISRLAGAEARSIARALTEFAGLEHVMEVVGTLGGVRFVNDSKATNVDAAARSIESFDRVVAIVGGRYKGGRLEELRGALAKHGRGVVAIGEARDRIRVALAGVVPIVDAVGMPDAVRQGWEMAKPDGVVLLAPACSSFDMFADYADRGRRFKAEVRTLIEDAGDDAREP